MRKNRWGNDVPNAQPSMSTASSRVFMQLCIGKAAHQGIDRNMCMGRWEMAHSIHGITLASLAHPHSFDAHDGSPADLREWNDDVQYISLQRGQYSRADPTPGSSEDPI